MNYGSVLFAGVFLTFFSAWVGLVALPHWQLKDLQPRQVEGVSHPRPYTEQELVGRRVYQGEGCVYCHSQQIRGGRFVNDEFRGWGSRRSVPQDYLFDDPVLLGTMRTGPDLLNIGKRQPDATWHHQHLYDPQLVSPGSIMQPFSYLYEKRRVDGAPSPNAVPFDYAYVTLENDSDQVMDALKSAGFRPIEQRDGRWVGALDPAQIEVIRQIPQVKSVEPYVEPGYEIVPTPRAEALVAYLRSLDRTYELEESQ